MLGALLKILHPRDKSVLARFSATRFHVFFRCQAASYEVVFMLLVAACCALAAALAVLASTFTILHRDHCLRAELLVARADRTVGSTAWLQAEFAEVSCLLS